MALINHRLAWSDTETAFITFLVAIGALEATKLLLRLLSGIYIYFIRPGKPIKSYGPWAVVTGATDGIGRAYADALAKKGLNVVLISRTQAKLETVANEISSAYKVDTKVVAADFSKMDENAWSLIKATLKPLDIGLLISNVGLSYNHAEYLDAVDVDLIDNLVQVNIVALTKFAKIVLPGMKQRKKPSAIINIGSGAGSILPSGPLYSVYAGSKAYVDMFNKSLHLEYKTAGISVQNQAPLFVATRMSKIRRPTLDAPSPKKWVSCAIKQIGYEATSCPYWFHGVMWAVINSLPDVIVNGLLFKLYIGYRDKYYKKKARDAKQT